MVLFKKEWLKASLWEILLYASNFIVVKSCDVISGIRGSREDAQALRITVTRQVNGYESVIFLAYFLAVDATDVDLVSRVTLLPVIIAHICLKWYTT